MAQRNEPGAVHQQRWQEDDQDQFGVKRDDRQAGYEGEQGAAGQQGDRWRQAQPMRGIMKRDDCQQHGHQQFEQFHRMHRPGPCLSITLP